MALDLAQMVLEVRKNLQPTKFYMLNIFDFNNFPKKSSPGGVLSLGLLLAVYGPVLGPDGPGLSAYSWLSMALDLVQMVLEVRSTLNKPSFTC